jgi:signal transduction histidine kinase
VSLQALLRGAQRLVWSDGRSYLSAASASSPLSDYPGMGWVVVVRQPQELALAKAIALERRLIWLSVVGAALFGALGWFLADRLTRPLRRVAAQAQGMLPATNEAPPHDEVDQLARTLASLLADLKQREQDLTSLNEGLETRVQERTASLRRANDDLRAFSRSVSHDIQGPLGSMAQLLRQTVDKDGSALPPQASEVMQLVAQECERLKQLSAELLTLAMVEQSEIAVEPVDHGALARDVVAQLSMGASHAFPAIEIGNLPTLPGDAVMLRQVWSNLLSNAVKFTSKVPAPRIEVSAEARDGEVVFTVADNGAGFDEAQSDRLFGVFQRLHRASQFPGTGVGLSIVRRVVLRHGGRVWAQSPPGQGARFHFCLPERFDDGVADHHPPPKALTSATV